MNNILAVGDFRAISGLAKARVLAVLLAIALVFGQFGLATPAIASSPVSPSIASVSPASAAAGTPSITITGSNFSNTSADKVFFNALEAPVTSRSASTLVVNVPAGLTTPGLVNIRVTTPTGEVVANGAFRVIAANPVLPTLTRITPSSVGLSGYQSVAISGTNLLGATAVTFGGIPAVSFSIVSDSQISAIVPTSTVTGNVAVRVTTARGTSTSPLNVSYAAGCSLGQVSKLAFPAGSSKLTTKLKRQIRTAALALVNEECTEVHLLRYNAKKKRSMSASDKRYIDLQRERAFAVAGLLQNRFTLLGANVRVTFVKRANQVSQVRTAFDSNVKYRVLTLSIRNSDRPGIIRTYPSAGAIAGGTSVVIRGANLDEVTGVKFGGTDAVFNVVSASQINVVAPTKTVAQNAEITLATAKGSFVTGAKFSYLTAPAITSLSASTSGIAGTATISITGSNFIGLQGLDAVKFGSISATSYRVLSSSRIDAVVPANFAGDQNVSIVAAGGVTTSVKFTYLSHPVITGVSPNKGTAPQSVTITGSGFFNAAGTSGVTDVKFGATSGTGFSASSATSLTVTTPSGLTAPYLSVSVVTAGGEAILKDGYSASAAIFASTSRAILTKGSPNVLTQVPTLSFNPFFSSPTFTIAKKDGTTLEYDTDLGLSFEGGVLAVDVGTVTPANGVYTYVITATESVNGSPVTATVEIQIEVK